MFMFQLRYKVNCFSPFFTIYVFRKDVFGDVNKMFYICRSEINTIPKPIN